MTVGGATIRQGDVVVLDADGAVVVEQERVDEVLAAARDRAEREREKRAKLQAGRALLRPRRPASARRVDDRAAPRHRADRARRAADAEAGREPALLRRRARHGGGGARGAVRLPARLGRLPPLQPEADGVAAGRSRPRGPARVEPRGARAAGRRDRGDRARHGLDRRRRRPRAAPTASPTRTATCSSSTTRPSATSRPST